MGQFSKLKLKGLQAVQCSDAGSFLKSVENRKISSEHEQKPRTS